MRLHSAIIAAALAATAAAGCSDDKTSNVTVSQTGVAARVANPQTASGDVVVPYRLVGESGLVADVIVEFTADGGATYARAQEAAGQGGSSGTANLPLAPAPGAQYAFAWAGFPRNVPVTLIITPVVGGRLGIPGQISFTTPVRADRFEPANDTPGNAPTLPTGTALDLSIGPDGADVDHFLFDDAGGPALIEASAAFESRLSDLDLFLADQAGTPLDESATEADLETIRFFTPGNQLFQLRVESFDALPNTYSLAITETAVTVDLPTQTFESFANLAALTASGWSLVTTSGPGTVWELGLPGAASPVTSTSKVIATRLSGTYPNDADQSLITPAVVVSGSRTFLTFKAYVETEGAPFDLCAIEAQVNGAGPFTQVEVLEDDLTLGGGFRQFVVTGPTGLTPGNTVRFAFHFESDDDIALAGVYIDDVTVVSAP